ncbi:hypothetical protein PV364_36310 [Streptomyces sp. MI02-7b]|nr:hypothetical protein [Streptomyces sp. MI02-7b]MDX3077769.1 hypothetical protein [Streptomyces sp. MI02-7b]
MSHHERGGTGSLADPRGRPPVIDETRRLIGVISSADLLRIFLRRDRAIREEIAGDLLVKTLGLPPNAVTVRVEDGKVFLEEVVDRKIS